MERSKKSCKTTPKEELTASPREGCIEVFKMRLRIHLFEQHTRKNRREGDAATVAGTVAGTQDDGATVADGENETNGRDDSDIPGPDGWNNNALIVRRRNTLLVSTRRGVGAIVFKFKSNQDCIEFCDRLVYLNRDYFKYDTAKSGYVNGMDAREQYCEELREAKRRRLMMLGDQQINGPRSSHRGGSAVEQELTAEDPRQNRRQDELLSYMVRLVNDEEFRQLVDEIERGLQSAPETAGVHHAMGF
jgi:hypothetical protein